ncbi:hypothetical protein CY35_03G036500 [Sphagnum magellanicum]|nr:hypothetical protein CY35_03G036500 [Sphagnum magellanicum]
MSSCHNFFKEALDLGVVIAWRFYGRYPETGRSYYKPPSGNETDRHKNPDRQISTRQAPSLVQSCQLLSSSILALQYHDHFSAFVFVARVFFFPTRLRNCAKRITVASKLHPVPRNF